METMLADNKVEMVYIATPASEHAAQVRLCIEAGKPVLCETPIALTAAALPLCLDVLKTRGIGRELAELVMILISVLICFGYAETAAANELTAERMTRTVLLAHVPAVLVYAAQWAAFWIRQGKQDS